MKHIAITKQENGAAYDVDAGPQDVGSDARLVAPVRANRRVMAAVLGAVAIGVVGIGFGLYEGSKSRIGPLTT